MGSYRKKEKPNERSSYGCFWTLSSPLTLTVPSHSYHRAVYPHANMIRSSSDRFGIPVAVRGKIGQQLYCPYLKCLTGMPQTHISQENTSILACYLERGTIQPSTLNELFADLWLEFRAEFVVSEGSVDVRSRPNLYVWATHISAK